MGQVVEPTGALKQRTLDKVLKKQQISPNLLTRMLFPARTHKLLGTDTVQWDELTRKNQMAPFRAVNGEPINLERRTFTAQAITTPYLAVSNPLSMSSALLERWAGQNNEFVEFGAKDTWVRQNIERTIVEDLQDLRLAVDNTVEWMIAQLLTGTIEYTDDDREGAGHFKLDTNKPAANTVDLATYLDTKAGADQTDAEAKKAVTALIAGIQKIKLMNARRHGPAITDALCGEDVALQIQRLIAAGAFKDIINKDQNLINGTAFDTTREWNQTEGTLLLGTIEGVRFWTYTHVLPNPANPLEFKRLIRGNYIEFLSPGGGMQERRMYFGAIMNDLDAVRKGLHVNKYFSKTIKHDEPSYLEQIVKSRPLPFFRRPDWFFSMQAVASESAVEEPILG